MKLTLSPVCLVGILFLTIICLLLVDFGMINNIFNIHLPNIDINWVENHVDSAIPFENSFIGYFFKVSLPPAPYNDFFAIRPAPPVWEKILPEYISIPINFFCPIMVIVIFLFFYQSSRNSAGLDHLTGFSTVSL